MGAAQEAQACLAFYRGLGRRESLRDLCRAVLAFLEKLNWSSSQVRKPWRLKDFLGPIYGKAKACRRLIPRVANLFLAKHKTIISLRDMNN